MRRRNREINIFSMSALDLFASGMGAFILIMLILMPYYLNKARPLQEKVKDLQAKLAGVEKQLEQCRRKEKACQVSLGQARAAVSKARASLSSAQARARAAEKRARRAEAALRQGSGMEGRLKACVEKRRSCQARLDNSIKFALLGLSTRAESFVLVVDMSGSMKSYTRLMQSTIARILKPMKARNRIQIIGFQGESNNPVIHRWLPSGQMLAMDLAGKQRALRYSYGLAHRYGEKTPTHAALLEALRYPAQAIVLLTDGSPNSDPKMIINDITRRNAGRKEIHTVAIGEYWSNRKMVSFLSALAKRNRGDFTGVAGIR